MATYTAPQAVAGFQAHGRTRVFTGTVTLPAATALAINDVLEFIRIPPCTVLMGWFQAPDLDTNATETLDIDIGWAANGAESADADGFGNFGVITGDAVTGIKPEVGVWIPLGGVLRTNGTQAFTRETVIQGDVNANPATGATAVSLAVHLLCQTS